MGHTFRHDHHRSGRTARGFGGFSSAVSLLSVALGLVVVAVLLVISMNAFGGPTGGTGSKGQSPSIISRSTGESELKLCAEGRASSYGDPPSSAQQAKCLDKLAGQISGGAPSLPGTP